MSNETRQQSAVTTVLRAWEEGVTALFGGYGRHADPLGVGIWGLRVEPAAAARSFQSIADASRELTRAQIGVASEWLRMPLWLTGAASPSGLQASYTQLFQACGGLLTAYIDAALPVWRSAERGTEAAIDVAATKVETARDVPVTTARAEGESTAAAVETTGAAVDAVEQAIAVATAAEAKAQRPIKGKVTREGEKIYHLPGQVNYDRFEADALFETEAEAQAAGFRPARR